MVKLSEISENDATGVIADIYQDIRTSLGLPLVNLIYRHLATKPVLFEKIWGSLSQAIRGRDLTQSVTDYMETIHVGWIAPLPISLLETSGMTNKERQMANQTIKVYERANKMNAVIMRHLLSNSENHIDSDSEVPFKWMPQAEISEPVHILPMQDLIAFPPYKIEALEKLSTVTVGKHDGVPVIPSLYRHFSHKPAILTALWVATSTKEYREKMKVWDAGLKQKVREDASKIHSSPVKLDPETIKVIKAFGDSIIIRMLPTGRMLERLISGDEA